MINVVLMHISNTYYKYILKICQRIIFIIFFHIEETLEDREFLESGAKNRIFNRREAGISSF